MAINYARLLNRRVTSQSQPIPGSNQVANSDGGYSWQVNDWTRLDRFLILGAEGGTYYIAERDLVKQNHDAIVRCLQADGVRAVKRIVEISESGRAPKNDPAVFALALATTSAAPEAKALACNIVPGRLPPGPAFEDWIKKFVPTGGPPNLHPEQPPPGASPGPKTGGHGQHGKIDPR